MFVLPDAWQTPEPEWVSLAPGVKWLLLRPDGAVRAMVAGDVAAIMGKVYQGRAALDALGVDPENLDGGPLELEQLAQYASVLTACLYARHCLKGWKGIDHPKTGEPLDFADPDNIRASLLKGAPPEGDALMVPFLAWVEGPRRPMAAEGVRLRKLSKDHWSGGAERCAACIDMSEACARGGSLDGEICPRLALAPQTPDGVTAWEMATTTSGLWLRAGMSGAISGLDYRSALLMFEAAREAVSERSDHGAALAAFRAIEQGRLEAEAERADAQKAAQSDG